MKLRPASAFILPLIVFFISCTGEPGTKKKPGKNDTTTTAGSVTHLNKDYFTDCRQLHSEARKMDSVLMQQTEVETALANKAMKAFTDFAYYCQKDSMSPVFLIKTAQVARAINNIPQAKLVLEKCLETYPSFRNRPAALFLLAQLYDERTYLNNEHEARKLYEEIIRDYPKSDWAISAEGAIRFLGKTDEEIMKEFKKKHKK
jgi:hypothetical protein